MSQPALRRYVLDNDPVLVKSYGPNLKRGTAIYLATDIEPLLKCWAKIVMGEMVPSVEEYKEAKRLLARLTEWS